MRTRNFRKIYEGSNNEAIVYVDTLDEALECDKHFLNFYPSQGFIRYIPKDAKLGGL